MANDDKKMVTFNWRAIGRALLALIKFIKWPVALLAVTYMIVTMPDWRGFHVDWELLLKYIKAVIWPVVAVYALWLIRPNIPGLMGRLEELNSPVGNAKFAKSQSKSENQGEELKEIAPDASKPNTKSTADFQITDDDTHASLTSFDAAVAYVQVYADIFGTQVEVLRRLADYTSGLKRDDLADILKEHQRRTGGKGFDSIVPFMEYLIRNILVLYDEQTQMYKLTIAGFYFLVFLHKTELLDRSKEG